jgi:DNA-directed RNA polymerase subunit RPC12/RpoP
MRAALARHPACAKCAAPMDQVEAVAVLTSLEGHSIFECEWCGHITLVPHKTPTPSTSWIGSVPAACGVSYEIRCDVAA